MASATYRSKEKKRHSRHRRSVSLEEVIDPFGEKEVAFRPIHQQKSDDLVEVMYNRAKEKQRKSLLLGSTPPAFLDAEQQKLIEESKAKEPYDVPDMEEETSSYVDNETSSSSQQYGQHGRQSSYFEMIKAREDEREQNNNNSRSASYPPS
eukprot:UN33897